MNSSRLTGGVAVVVAALALPLGAARGAGDSPVATSWTGAAQGGVVQDRHFETTDPSRPFSADDRQVYKGRFTFSFRVSRSGAITGRGSGRYLTGTWHAAGTFHSSPFSCDAPMRLAPFTVGVTGRAAGGRITLELRPHAKETNQRDVACLPNFKLTAGTTTRLADSFDAVGGRTISFAKRKPAVPPLSKAEDFVNDSIPTSPPTSAHVVRTSQWKITIRRQRGGA